jgi:hypothetical protein
MQIHGLGRTEMDQLESNKCQSWLGGQASEFGLGAYGAIHSPYFCSFFSKPNPKQADSKSPEMWSTLLIMKSNREHFELRELNLFSF